MNNIEKIYQDNKNIQSFAKKYFDYLSKLLLQIDTKSIAAFVEELESARNDGNTIFVIGNGGSAATASHLANDIGMVMVKQNENKTPFRVLSLSDNVSIMTAIANDYGYQDVFLDQLKIHFKTGDKLIAISASGNSPNLITAANWVKENGGKVIGFLGFDGGKLKDISDVSILINTPNGEYGPVEDVHIIMDHLVTSWLQCKYQR
jgi:D-sedoheptulose 7-phosphate isomerase